MLINKRLLFVLLYGLIIFLGLNRHARSGLFNYHSEIYSDKSGYFVYLPAAFCYGFDAKAFPKGIDKRMGDGFQLNRFNGKVETKYSYGTALMEAPFWAVAHVLSPEKGGFSKLEHKAINIAAATYFVWALGLLFSTLCRRFSTSVTTLTLLILVLGTNLWYYAVIETGMSHIYSFFAFSLLLYLLTNTEGGAWHSSAAPIKRKVLVAATVALISIIRPLDLVFALPLLGWPAIDGLEWRQQGRDLLNWRFIGLLAGIGILFWLPQLAYYYYLRGSLLVYSYGKEGFPYWNAPRFAEVWLAPKDGSFLYNPILLMALPGYLLLARYSPQRGWLAFSVWLGASYLYASWWAYDMSCGYGERAFIDLYPVAAWPIAAVVSYLLANRSQLRWVAAGLIVLLIAYNLRLSMRFDRCFYGTDWDWETFKKLLL